MRVIYGVSNIPGYRRAVLALGVFDGVHLAHRKILAAVVKKAKAINGTSIVVTFWPHPQQQDTIFSLEYRLREIARIGINVCIVLKFNKKLSGLSADKFITDILLNKIHASYIYIGRNFRFGRGAVGDFRLLYNSSRMHNFKVCVFDTIRIGSRQVSSTYIRKLIYSGKLDEAKRLLNRPVGIFGTVVRGQSLATKLGFPTANIDPHHEVLPPSGIYAVRVIINNKLFGGVCYIGRKKTFVNKGRRFIEVHIFDFSRNIYHRDIEVQFIKRLRGDRKFKSAQLLVAQIKKDVYLARKYS